MDDVRGDGTDGSRWLSYAELAEARGISRRSAIRLTYRHRWPRRDANDGTVRVAVPMSELRRAPEVGSVTRDDKHGITYDDTGDDTPRIRALEAHLETLREGLARAEGRADVSEARIRELTAEVDARGERIAELREERAAANVRAEVLQAQMDRLTDFPGAALLARLRTTLRRL